MIPRDAHIGDIEIGTSEVAHKVILQKLRERILLGKLAPGTKLPSTTALASRWKTSRSTMHTALSNLVKEGLLERNHGSATYVSMRPRTLDRVGIYYDSPRVWTDEERVFVRSLQRQLEAKLAKMGIKISVFVDRRPKAKQRLVLQELSRAVAYGEIQGLIIATTNDFNLSALLNLHLPLSVMTGDTEIGCRIMSSEKQIFGSIFQRLAKKKCRSVGLISSLQTIPDLPNLSDELYFTAHFLEEAERHRMLTRKEWTRVPREYVVEKALYGYNDFHSLWGQPEHPEAVLVYPDMVVRGVITAALELGAHLSEKLTFCFHRNAHVDILCPFPALWTITDEAKIADALIDLVRRQHEGKPITPVIVPSIFEESLRTV